MSVQEYVGNAPNDLYYAHGAPSRGHGDRTSGDLVETVCQSSESEL
jgi:hypothetical protein